MQILGISGSVRSASSHSTLLRALAQVGTADVNVAIYTGLVDVPIFNPDIDDAHVPSAVIELRKTIDASAAIVFCTPEYAHGVPGALKNALDWLVGSGELIDKPVAVISPSGRGVYARASLLETLRVMSARVVHEACVILTHVDRVRDESDLLNDASAARQLRSALDDLVRAIPSASPPASSH